MARHFSYLLVGPHLHLAQQLQANQVLALAQQLDLNRDLVSVLTYPQPAP